MNQDKIAKRLRSLLDPEGGLKEGVFEESARLVQKTTHGFKNGTSSGQLAITFDFLKTAALCFEKVWSFDSTVVPPEIGFFGGSDEELLITLRILTMQPMGKVFGRFGSPSFDLISEEMSDLGVLRDKLLPKVMASPFGDKDSQVLRKDVTHEMTLKALANCIGKKVEKHVIPVYSSHSTFEEEYTLGEHGVVAGILSNTEVVVEDELNWEQVIEFRSDIQSKVSYRRFLHWLDTEMIGKPNSFVVNEVGIRMEKYRSALKKHGIKTRLGIMEVFLNSHSLLSSVAGGVAGMIETGNPLIAGLAAVGAGTLIVSGKIALRIQHFLLDLEDLRSGPNSEVAFIHELSEKIGK